MKKISIISVILFGIIAMSACTEMNEVDTEKVQYAIQRIDQASESEPESVTLARESFDALNESEKMLVTNYTKLFYLTATDPEQIIIDLKGKSISVDVQMAYLGQGFVVSGLSDMKSQMSEIDFSEADLSKIDQSVFEGKTVIASIEPTHWYHISSQEDFSYRLYSDGLMLVFCKKQPYALPDASHYAVRLIILDTVYPLEFFPDIPVLFTTEELMCPDCAQGVSNRTP